MNFYGSYPPAQRPGLKAIIGFAVLYPFQDDNVESGLSLNFDSERLSRGALDDVSSIAVAGVLETCIDVLDGGAAIHADFAEHIAHHVEDLEFTCGLRYDPRSRCKF